MKTIISILNDSCTFNQLLGKKNKAYKILAIVLILVPLDALAQVPEIEWQKNFGGTDNDRANSVQMTSDGGYIIFGNSNSEDGDVSGNHGDNDFWVVKLNELGAIEWQKSLGGSESDIGYAVQQTDDGGYILAGSSTSNDGDVSGNHGNYDFWVVKLNAQGSIQWQKSLGGSDSENARDIKQTQDGGYLVFGSSSSSDGDITINYGSSDYWVVKLDATGNIEMQITFGSPSFELGIAAELTNDGGFILSGHKQNNFWIVKVSQTGNIIWEKTMGGSANDFVSNIKQTADGGYIIAGSSDSVDGDVGGNHGDFDYWVVKLDSNGILEWQKSYGGSGYDSAQDIQIASGGYIISGVSESNDGDVSGQQGDGDFWVVKIDGSGNIQWQKTMGGSMEDSAQKLQQTPDNGFIIAGHTYSNDGDVSGNHGENDYWIVKLEPDPLDVEQFGKQIHIYPNPVSSILNIAAADTIKTVLFFNQTGQLIQSTAHDALDIELQVSGLQAGLYFVVVETEKSTETFKIIVR